MIYFVVGRQDWLAQMELSNGSVYTFLPAVCILSNILVLIGGDCCLKPYHVVFGRSESCIWQARALLANLRQHEMEWLANFWSRGLGTGREFTNDTLVDFMQGFCERLRVIGTSGFCAAWMKGRFREWMKTLCVLS